MADEKVYKVHKHMRIHRSSNAHAQAHSVIERKRIVATALDAADDDDDDDKKNVISNEHSHVPFSIRSERGD